MARYSACHSGRGLRFARPDMILTARYRTVRADFYVTVNCAGAKIKYCLCRCVSAVNPSRPPFKKECVIRGKADFSQLLRHLSRNERPVIDEGLG